MARIRKRRAPAAARLRLDAAHSTHQSRMPRICHRGAHVGNSRPGQNRRNRKLARHDLPQLRDPRICGEQTSTGRPLGPQRSAPETAKLQMMTSIGEATPKVKSGHFPMTTWGQRTGEQGRRGQSSPDIKSGWPMFSIPSPPRSGHATSGSTAWRTTSTILRTPDALGDDSSFLAVTQQQWRACVRRMLRCKLACILPSSCLDPR